MNTEIIAAWELAKPAIRAAIAAKHPGSYRELVTLVVGEVADRMTGYPVPDKSRVEEIDHGDYQGTLVYVIGATGYQPDDYWYVRVSYGSCSGCDTLESICGYSGEPPTDAQVGEYMTLALHIVQRMKKMDGEAA